MEKITKKEFVEILNNNANILAGAVNRWNDEKCLKALENVKEISKKLERRTIAENHANYIIFSNGSYLYFDQHGKKEYFRHINKAGITFIYQRTAYFDEFDNKEQKDYIIYEIIEK